MTYCKDWHNQRTDSDCRNGKTFFFKIPIPEVAKKIAVARANAKGKTDELLDLAANVIVAHRELNDDDLASLLILNATIKKLELFITNLSKEE